MAQKCPEPTLREVLQVVTALTSRITTLESVIINQGVLIANLAQDTRLIKSAVEGKPKEFIQVPTVPATGVTTIATPTLTSATQRPLRQARINAGTFAAAIGSKKGHGTDIKKTIIGKQKPQLLADKVMTPEVTRPVLIDTTPPTDTDNLTISIPSQGMATKQTINTKLSDDNADTSNWKKVTKKSSKKSKIISGIGQADNELRTVERLKYIQAWQFKPDTTKQNILNHLNRIAECNEYYVEKRETKANWHAVFVIGCPESLYERINSPTLWPTGVRVSHWNFRARTSIDRTM